MSVESSNLMFRPNRGTVGNLSRDDFDGGPISLDKIEDGLYLGNVTAATDLKILKANRISYILTIDSCPLPSHISEMQSLTTKYVHASDVPKEDLLNRFDECTAFIRKGHNEGKVVLVHCYYGMSRSATIVIAYIMQTYTMPYGQAFEMVKSKRKLASPNTGFVSQLKLYQRMNYRIDPTHEKYKMYRLRLAADQVRKAKILPQSCLDLVKPDPEITQICPEPIVYRCRRCRRILAAKSNIMLHKPYANKQLPADTSAPNLFSESVRRSHSESLSHSAEDGNGIVDRNEPTIATVKSLLPVHCNKMHFVEPIAWMKEIYTNTQGRLCCPKCSCKLGNFSWVMGCKCPCGEQISPAFYLVPSKVEYSTMVQNVQTTV